MTILLVAEIPENADRDLSIEREILGPDIGIRRFAYRDDDDELVASCEDAECILTDFVPFTRNVITRFPAAG